MDLETFLRPLDQDLDGVSRVDEVERIATIPQQNPPTPDPPVERRPLRAPGEAYP